MTIRQIANTAGCGISTVKRLVKDMYPELKSAGRGIALELSREQAVSLMNKLPKRNNVGLPSAIEPSDIGQMNQVTAVNNNMQEMSIMIAQAVAAAMIPVIQQVTNAMTEIKAPLQIEAPKEDYFSLMAYCSLHKIKTNRSELAMHGRELRKMVLSNDLQLRKIPDERYGEVNSYPVEILDEYFAV